MSKSLNFQYKHSAELNRECQLIRNAFNLNTTYDIFLLTTATFDNQKDQEWTGFVNAIRRYIKSQNMSNFSKINNQIKELRGEVTEELAWVHRKIDKQSKSMQALNAKLDKVLEVVKR